MSSKLEPVGEPSKLHHEKKANQMKNNENENNRFGSKSYNMFFLRHTAQPKNLKLITGL